MKRKTPQAVMDCFERIEREMFVGPWVMSETDTICDFYLFTVAAWWEGDSVDPTRIPKLAEHRKRMAERPAVTRALAAEGKK